jgi:DNA-binding transcriptional regulator YdaS (Cro superfamily)
METHRPYSEALRAALDILGGEKQLAQRLGVDANQLHAWVVGRATPPLGAFLEALDVIAEGPYSRASRPRPRVAVLPESSGKLV